MIMIAGKRPDGTNDFYAVPKVMNNKGSESDTPRAEIPIAFSKILVATAALASNIPDGHAYSTNKIKARLYYELWKRSFAIPEMNAVNTIEFATQQLFGTGTGAWRVYPRKVTVEKTNKEGIKAKKILYDDIFREPLDMNRTWLGLSYKATVDDGRPEVLYEIDITKDEYEKLKKKYNRKSKLDKENANNVGASAGVSEEATASDAEKAKNYVTITFYENPKDNRLIVASDTTDFYDGEMPNEEVYGSVVIAHCFHKNMLSPYGVGLWELIRGNQAIQNYIESLNTEQVASEIIPMIFASGNIQGDMTIKRSTSKMNVVPAGVKVERFLSTGNSTLGMNYIERKKKEVDEITGVNDVVAGAAAENTLGSTMILKEAALNRLMKPRNSLKRALEKDACIHFSWIEQDQIGGREYIFSSEEEAKYFEQVNPMHENELEVGFADDGTTPNSWKLISSPLVAVNFDVNNDKLTESNYEMQDVDEVGDNKILRSRSKLLGSVEELSEADKIGYDKVSLVIDPNSMLIPSHEIEKQNAIQLFPIVQNTLMQIYGLARQDPEQAKAQLKSFSKLLQTLKQNVNDYIPKEDYDRIMAMQMVPPPPDPMVLAMGGGMPPEEGEVPLGADNTPIGQAQSMNEMPVQKGGMESAFNGSMVRNARENKIK
jgi:hypothetical protein